MTHIPPSGGRFVLICLVLDCGVYAAVDRLAGRYAQRNCFAAVGGTPHTQYDVVIRVPRMRVRSTRRTGTRSWRAWLGGTSSISPWSAAAWSH